MTDRCIQCGWTVSERNLEVVLRGDPRNAHCETLFLHKGGCTQTKPLSKDGDK